MFGVSVDTHGGWDPRQSRMELNFSQPRGLGIGMGKDLDPRGGDRGNTPSFRPIVVHIIIVYFYNTLFKIKCQLQKILKKLHIMFYINRVIRLIREGQNSKCVFGLELVKLILSELDL